MVTDIIMPNLGFDAQEVRLIEWLKQPGDSIQKGEPIAIIESDKANVELESIASGILLEQLCASNEQVPIGSVIARVGSAEEMTLAVAMAASLPGRVLEVSPVARRLAAEAQVDLNLVKGSGPHGRIMREDVEAFLRQKTAPESATNAVRALPKVRRAARAARINLADVLATGPHGQVTRSDLERYQQQPVTVYMPMSEPATATEGVRTIPLSRTRQLIGERLSASKREAPHFYVTGEFDLEAALARLKTMLTPQLGLNDLLQYLTVQTLLRVPELNATYEQGRLYQHQSVHLALAIARDDGLITPVIAYAERHSFQGLAGESQALIKRARANRLQATDLQPATFTISNLGMVRQVDQFTAVINPPQVAILAVGTVKQRPIVLDGGLYVRSTVILTLSGDHRVLDGMHLARFMQAFQTELDSFSRT